MSEQTQKAGILCKGRGDSPYMLELHPRLETLPLEEHWYQLVSLTPTLEFPSYGWLFVATFACYTCSWPFLVKADSHVHSLLVFEFVQTLGTCSSITAN